MSTRAKHLAASILTKYRISEPPVPIEAIISGEGAQLVFHDLEDHVSGLLLRQRGQATIGINVKHHPNRQRFTMAHELGHLLLHKTGTGVFVDEYVIQFRHKGTNSQDARVELEANAFAAHLLIPEDFVKMEIAGRSLDLSDEQAINTLARRYEVSVQALTIQLVNLGIAGRF
jgi:Zn-dependent peptidase ImmA (M78 family)